MRFTNFVVLKLVMASRMVNEAGCRLKKCVVGGKILFGLGSSTNPELTSRGTVDRQLHCPHDEEESWSSMKNEQEFASRAGPIIHRPHC